MWFQGIVSNSTDVVSSEGCTASSVTNTQKKIKSNEQSGWRQRLFHATVCTCSLVNTWMSLDGCVSMTVVPKIKFRQSTTAISVFRILQNYFCLSCFAVQNACSIFLFDDFAKKKIFRLLLHPMVRRRHFHRSVNRSRDPRTSRSWRVDVIKSFHDTVAKFLHKPFSLSAEDVSRTEDEFLVGKPLRSPPLHLSVYSLLCAYQCWARASCPEDGFPPAPSDGPALLGLCWK